MKSGTILDGRYHLVKLIGAGGMGEVYEAIQVAIGRRVAVKCLLSSLSNSEEAVHRFQREAQLAGSIGHDNICEVTDIGTTPDGAPYLVMPLLKGKSLADLLTDSEPLAIARLIDIVCQTLNALEAAHNNRIVHRDLKPENIFVSKVGDREDFVKLLDFGISKILDRNSVSHLTHTGTVVGTPHYMSPEQAKGSNQINYLVDIYAVGVILYEGLTGLLPFEGDSYNEVMYKIISEPYAAPSNLNASISPILEKVVLKAMSRDRAFRFASAAEMRQALERVRVMSPIDDSTSLSSMRATADSTSPPESVVAWNDEPFVPKKRFTLARFFSLFVHAIQKDQRIRYTLLVMATLAIAAGITFVAIRDTLEQPGTSKVQEPIEKKPRAIPSVPQEQSTLEKRKGKVATIVDTVTKIPSKKATATEPFSSKDKKQLERLNLENNTEKSEKGRRNNTQPVSSKGFTSRRKKVSLGIHNAPKPADNSDKPKTSSDDKIDRIKGRFGTEFIFDK